MGAGRTCYLNFSNGGGAHKRDFTVHDEHINWGLFQGQEEPYLTQPVQSQSPVSFAASPSYYQGTKKISLH